MISRSGYAIRTFTVALLLLNSCKEQAPDQLIEEGELEGVLYSCDEIGWKMELPRGWDLLELNEMRAINERGIQSVADNTGAKVDDTGMKLLVSIQAEKPNMLSSSIQKMELKSKAEWESINDFTKAILYDTFTAKGIEVDTMSATVKIDDLAFDVFKIVHQKDHTVYLTQIMLLRYINGYIFNINLNYDNERDQRDLFHAVRNSTFSIREEPW